MDAKLKQNLQPNQKVMIRRLGDGKEYRGIIVGLHGQEDPMVDFYIIEMVDRLENYKWSHRVHIESCIDAEEWEDDFHGTVELTSEY